MKLNEINNMTTPSGASRHAAAGVRLGWAEIFLPVRWKEQGGEIGWRLRGAGGKDRQGRLTDLELLPDAVRSARIQVWAPATETVLLRASLPTRSRSRIRKALPFALEDQLLDPPESLNFCHVTDADGSLAVAVTARARLRDWTAALESAGLRPESLAPATLSLPHVPGAWTVGFTPGEIILRTGEFSGQGGPREVAAPAWLRIVLAEAQREGRAPERLIVQDRPAELDLAAWSEALGIPVVEPAVERPSLALPCTLNLLEGEFALRGRWREAVRPFFPALVLLLGWAVVAGLASVGEWWNLSRTYQQQKREMDGLFLRSFPENKEAYNAFDQMKKGVERLALRRGSSIAADDLLGLLGSVAPVLQSERRAKVKGVTYAEHALTLTLVVQDEAVVGALAQALRAAKLDAQPGEVQKRADGAEVRVVVRAAAGKDVARRAP